VFFHLFLILIEAVIQVFDVSQVFVLHLQVIVAIIAPLPESLFAPLQQVLQELLVFLMDSLYINQLLFILILQLRVLIPICLLDFHDLCLQLILHFIRL
jgi:hypothetical protein